MIDLLRLCRLYYSVPMSLAYALTVCYALGDAMLAKRQGTILSTVALALVISTAYVFNDVCDANVDRVNAPARPIAARRVRPATAIAWAAGLLAAGMAVAALCRWQFLAALSVVAAGLIVYDLFSKRLGIGKQLLVAALMTSMYPLAFAQAGVTSGPRVPALAIFPIWMFLSSFGYEVLKDIRDRRGDRSAAGRVTWVQRSPRLARRTSAAALILGAVALIGPYWAGCGWVYMTVVSPAILVALASAFLPRRWALGLIYVEFVLVGIAATADLIALGT